MIGFNPVNNLKGRRNVSKQFLEVEPDLDLLRRFFAKCEEARDRSGCWLWTAATDQKGYPQFSYKDKTVGAKRFALALFRGLVANLKHVKAVNGCRHGKMCVNPAHSHEKV